MPITTKLVRVVTYHEELPFIKSHEPSIIRYISTVTRSITDRVDRVVTYRRDSHRPVI